nr:uncharacterized protein LOC106626926 [Bactrocera oleae]
MATESIAKPKGKERIRFLVDETNRDHEPYADLALYMVERYISAKTSTLIIMENCEHCLPGLQNMHTRMLRYFLKRFNPTMSLQLFFGLPEDRLWDYNIFIVDSMHAFNLEHDRLFSRHLHDFHGCPLLICLELGYPLLGFHGNLSDPQDLQNIHLVAGIEGDLLRDLAKAINFRVKFSISRERGLAAGKADLAIGCLSSTDGLRHVFSYSLSYYQSLYVFIVRSGLHFGPIKQLAQAFCANVWQAIGACCIIGMIFIRFIISCTSSAVCEKLIGQRKHSDSTNLIVVMMGNPIKILPRRNCARLLLMSWLLATLVLRNAYQAKLFDSLRISKRIPIPRTISGLEAQNYILVTDKYVEFYPSNMTRIISNITQRYRMVQQSERERFITTSMLDTLSWHNRQNWKTSCLTYIEEPIYNVQISMYFKKHSILRSIFDYRIKQLSWGGITSYIGEKHVKKQFQPVLSLHWNYWPEDRQVLNEP